MKASGLIPRDPLAVRTGVPIYVSRSVFADQHPSAEPVSGGDDPVELARWLDDLKPGDFSTQTDGV